MTDATPRPPDLALARAQVQAFAAGSGMAREAPAAHAEYPLRLLDPVTEAKLVKRAGAGRPTMAARTVVPATALAVLDAVLLVVALVAGNTVFVVVAAVLLIVLGGIAFGGWRVMTGDPLRLSTAERRAIAQARSWRSRQDWTGPPAGGAEYGLVVAAADAATRIARTPFWRAGEVHDVHVQLDLARELDAVDAEAHRIAVAGGAERDPAWPALLDRVAALTAYANQVDGYERRRDAIAARNAGQTDTLMPDDMDEHELVALLIYLNATQSR